MKTESSRLQTAKAAHSAIVANLASVETAILEKQRIIAASVPDESRLKAAQEALEDAAAIQATGGKGGDMAALRAEFEAATAAHEADSAACAIVAKEAETALAGLIRRRESLQAEFGSVQHAFRDAVQEALERERDTLLGDYLDAANTIARCHASVMALAMVAGQSNFNLGPLWMGITPPQLPRPILAGNLPVAFSGSDAGQCFTALSLSELSQRSESEIAARYAELLN